MAVAALLLAGFPYFGGFMNANERPRLLQGIAWIEEGSSAIDGPATGHIDPGIDVARSSSGQLVPNKPPGGTVPAAMAWVVMGADPDHDIDLRTLTWGARVLGAWLPAIVLLAFARRRLARDFGVAAATAAVVLLGLGTPLASYAHVLYGHTLAACLLFVGAWWVVDAAAGGARWRAWAGGALAGAAVTVEYLVVFAAVPLGTWLMVRTWSRRPEPASLGSAQDDRRGSATVLVTALLGAAVPVAALALYHDAVFGSPFATPYHHVVRPEFAQIHERGLLGLSWPTARSLYEHGVSPWGGVLYWAPLCLAAVATSIRAWGRGEADGIEKVGVAIFALQLIVVLCLEQTGGWRVGPRYLVSAMPFALPGLARMLRWASDRPWLMVAVVALSVWSIPINLIAAHLFPHLIPTGHPLLDQLLPLFAAGLQPYGLAQAGLPSTSIVVVGGVLVAGACLHGLPGPAAHQGKAWIGGTAIAAIAFVLAVATIDPALQAETNLRAIEQVWEPSGG